MKERKRNRKKGFDYSSQGIYFLTICCKDRINHFGKIYNRKMELNEFGNILNGQIEWMEQQYPYFIIHNYIIMPNHLHILAEISRNRGESSHPIEMNGAAIDGDAMGAAINGDAMDAAINGDAMDATINGDAMGATINGDAMGTAINGDAMDTAINGDAMDAAINGDAMDTAINGDAMDTAINGDAMDTAINGDAMDAAINGDAMDAQVRTGRDLSLRCIPENEYQSHQSPQKIKSISELMGALKTTSSKKIHLAGNLQFQWQRSFHDHIVKSENAYWNIYNYITQNPEKWDGDIFYDLN